MDAWRELEEKAEGERLKYCRLIVDNRQLQRELRQLRLKYGFPLSDMQAALNWIDQQGENAVKGGKSVYYGPGYGPPDNRHTELGRLSDAINALMLNYDIPKKWWRNLFYSVLLADNFKSGPDISMGFPKVRIDMETGRHVLEVTDTLVNNPIVNDFIIYTQQINLRKEKIPLPIETGTRNKLDWQPVKEWFLSHPEIPKEQRYKLIADKLDYTPSYVKKKLAET